MSITKEHYILEYTKCVKDTPYALSTYLQTYDNTVSRYVPLELFPDQISLIEDYENYNENIALKYRQAGVSTVTAAWASKKIVFASKKKPEKILIIANKLETAIEMSNKVKSFISQWPKWMGIDFSKDKNSQRHYKLSNGCEVKAVATSKDALRGYTPTVLIFDEAAYIEADGDFWSACMASLSTGGKVIVISTPNGYDPIYYEIYDQALRNMNNFKISEMLWYKDPRYTKDLKLLKIENAINYILNKEDYPDIEIIDYSSVPYKERNFEEIKEKISDGFKPYSTWYEGMIRKFKFDRRKVSQELECNFLGSGDNVFESNLLQSVRHNMIREPINKLMGNSLWLWKEPVAGHRYILGCDVSRGDSEDFTSIVIIDFDEREQVAEYIGKIPPDVAAEIAYKWGTMYSAFIVVDITGGMGVSTSRKLQEMGYSGLYVDGIDFSNKWKYDPKSLDKIPGINFNSKRVQIISAFEEAMRHGFKVYSTRLLNEMNTFIYINGRPDHQKGHHDDLIMAISMAIFVGENSFTKLTKVNEQTKAMIDSWQVTDNQSISKNIAFNPVLPVGAINPMTAQNEATKNDYIKYSWLFGGKY